MECNCVFPDVRIKVKNKKVGRSLEYARWKSMMFRCYNPKSPDYKNYGGRGIKVCMQWHMSLTKYLSDIGTKPADKTLDRIENDGNYCPHNVQWSTRQEQSKNKRWNGPQNGLPLGVTRRLNLIKKQYQANIRIGDKLKHLGYFATPEEASDAYKKKYFEIHGKELGLN